MFERLHENAVQFYFLSVYTQLAVFSMSHFVSHLLPLMVNKDRKLHFLYSEQ